MPHRGLVESRVSRAKHSNGTALWAIRSEYCRCEVAVDLQARPKGETTIGGSSFVWGSRTYVMGVINVTPDSFSGDGLGSDADSALRQALSFQEWGADVVDVGGESTRPASIYEARSLSRRTRSCRE